VQWTTGFNWSSSPFVPNNTATFTNNGAPTSVLISANRSINTMMFTAGAPAYTFIPIFSNFTIAGTGIVNNSSNAPNFSITFASQLAFTNNSTAGNAAITTNFGGSALFSDNSTAANAAITNNGTLQFANTSTAGNAAITNNSLLRFTDTSTAGNSTITNNFLLRFTDTSTAGNATITNNSFLQFTATSTAGNATITNNFLLRFTDTSTAGNATIITNNGGATFFQDNSTGGLARLVTNSGGVVDISGLTSGGMTAGSIEGAGSYFLGSNTLTVGGNNLSTEVSGTIADGGLFGGVGGSLVKAGTGTLVLSNENTYTGGTTINGGTLQLGNGGASGSIIGNVVDNGTFAINRSDSYTFSGVISGTGTFAQIGPGTTILTAASTYSGGTAIDAGALIVNGSIASSSLTTVNSGAALLGSGTVGSTVVNTGGFLVPGSAGVLGTMTIAGNLALQSGAFYVVQVNPTTNSTTNVSGTASLAGTVGAIFAPGTYLTRSYTILTAAGGRTGTFDALATLGLPANFQPSLGYTGNTAVLNLTARLVPEPAPPTPTTTTTTTTTPTTTPTITTTTTTTTTRTPATITTTTITTTPTTTTTMTMTTTTAPPTPLAPPLPPIPGLPPTPGQPSTPPLPTFTVNQLNVGHAIDGFFNNGGAMPPAFVALFGLTGSNLTNALSQLSGEAATGSQKVGFQLTDQFLNLMLDPFVDGRSGVGGADHPALGFAPERETMPPDVALAYASVFKAPPAPVPVYEPRWTAWGGAYGGSNRTTGDLAVSGSHDLSARAVGFAAGLDYRLTPDTVVGFALAGGGTDWSLAQGLGGGKSDAFQAGVYGATRWGPAYLAAAFAFANHWMSTDRFAVGDHLTANFNAQSYGGRLEGGYRFATPYGGITPYAAIQAQSFHTPGYTETDTIANGFGLAFASRDATDTRSELGARFDRVLAVYSNAVFALRGRVAWAHDWVSDATLLPVFQALPGASFIVNGATLAKNSALTSAGAELRLANGVALLAKFDGEFASHSSTYGGTGTIRYRW